MNDKRLCTGAAGLAAYAAAGAVGLQLLTELARQNSLPALLGWLPGHLLPFLAGALVLGLALAGLALLTRRLWPGLLAVGLALNFSGPIPWGRFALFTLISWAVSMMVYALQQGLSLWFANQAAALVCGISGSFLGILSMLFPPALIRFVPWGYYGLMALVNMDWNETTRVTRFFWYWPLPTDVALLLVWTAVFLVVGRTLFVKKEV